MRLKLDRALRLLIVLNFCIVTLLALTMVADWLRILPSAGPAGPASPSPTPEQMQMGLAHIPTSNSCLLCHDSGGSSGVKVIPALGHPQQGWTACLTCHTNDKLGRAAPGHDGIAETECLNCHKVAKDGPAITQAHATLNQPCLDCHGSVAHLPSSMVGRNEKDCWLCHKPNPNPPPIKPHPDPASLTCRSCHQASDAGALPIDHALRSDSSCVLCHDLRVTVPSPTPAGGGT
jgi:hypothetical protein